MLHTELLNTVFAYKIDNYVFRTERCFISDDSPPYLHPNGYQRPRIYSQGPHCYQHNRKAGYRKIYIYARRHCGIAMYRVANVVHGRDYKRITSLNKSLNMKTNELKYKSDRCISQVNGDHQVSQLRELPSHRGQHQLFSSRFHPSFLKFPPQYCVLQTIRDDRQ
jgi:hypothetical protein